MTANVCAISIGQPHAWAIVKKGKHIEKMCRLVDVVTEATDRRFESE